MLVSIIFTTLFLTVNPLTSTFASPIASKHEGAAGQSVSPAHLLGKRIPGDNKCLASETWILRQCEPNIDDQTWEDECQSSSGGPGGRPFLQYRQGACQGNTMCVNTIGPAPENDRVIACVDRPGSNTVTPPDIQSGVYVVGKASQLNPPESMISVTLDKPLMHASITAYLEGSVIVPHPGVSHTDCR
jgi:hypothetical protein